MKNILIIDDDTEVRSIIKSYLEREGFSASCASSLTEGKTLFFGMAPDLVILDIFLPDGNGLEMCNSLRSCSMTPIILISAKGDESDKVLGLGLGADDFLTKPFSVNELVARVKAQIRRSESTFSPSAERTAPATTIVAGPIVINTESRTVFSHEKPLSLTAKEFDLLLFFSQNENRVFSKEHLYESVWGNELYGDIRTVMVYVRRLREKIEADPGDPRLILTVWGVGYKFTTSGPN